MGRANGDRSSAKPGQVVLGLETANAKAAERAHRADNRGSEQSPLAGVSYARTDENLRWFQTRWADTDAKIAEVAAAFATAPSAARERMTAALTIDDFYLLCRFAERSASFSLGERDLDVSASGLIGLAAIDPHRVDHRDLRWAAGYLRLAITKLTSLEEADRRFVEAASLAGPDTAKILSSFVGRGHEATAKGWLIEVIEVDGKLAIAERKKGPYEPSIDLLKTAQRLADELVADGLGGGTPVLGAVVPKVWLKSTPQAEETLASATAILGLGRWARPADKRFSQLFLGYVIELPSTEDQIAFVERWSLASRNFAALVVGSGRLVVMFITNSSERGVEPRETNESLARFVEPTSAILKAAV